jgi:hypothetical protein
VEETMNLQGCPKHYLEPDIVELSFDPVRQSCSDVYLSADLLLSTTCRRLNESQNCLKLPSHEYSTTNSFIRKHSGLLWRLSFKLRKQFWDSFNLLHVVERSKSADKYLT